MRPLPKFLHLVALEVGAAIANSAKLLTIGALAAFAFACIWLLAYAGG